MAELMIVEQLQIAKQMLIGVSDTPLLDAEILLAQALQVTRSYLYAWPHVSLQASVVDRFNTYLLRRVSHEPIAYILEKKEFWSFTVSVNSTVLIPRPETEELVELILNQGSNDINLKVADLGTGSGVIALALAIERPNWQIYATDIDSAALHLAKQNAQQLKLSHLSFYQGDWCQALPCADFDVIVSNPPYIARQEWHIYRRELVYEPKIALVSGEDGLDAIRDLIPIAKQYLKPSGRLFIEHGFLQGKAVRDLFHMAGYDFYDSIKDISGRERITWGGHHHTGC